MRRPRRSSAKFVRYFDLLDAFGKIGCAVCGLLEQGSRKALEGFLYEQVNDPETRRKLVASRGFCNWHSWLLADIQGSHLGVAVLGRHLLAEAAQALELSDPSAGAAGNWRGLFRRSRSRQAGALPAWWHGGTDCPLCAMMDRAERDYLILLLDFFEEADFATGFARSGGLCLPHLGRAVEIALHHAHLPALLAAHRDRWAALAAELDEFIRKYDYRFASEPMGAEGDSWSRVLEVLAGRAGLFGTGRPHDGRQTSRRGTTDRSE